MPLKLYSTLSRKIYKGLVTNNLNMNPGDPTGSPDESFFNSLIKYLNSKEN